MKKLVEKISVISAILLLSCTAYAGEGAVCGVPGGLSMPQYVIRQADFKGRIMENAAVFDVNFAVEILSDGNISVPLLSKDIAFIKDKLPQGVFFVQKEQWYNLVFQKKGSYKFSLQFAASVRQQDERNFINVKINPAAVSKLTVLFEGVDLDIKSGSAINAQVNPRGKQTELVAFMGNAGQIKVSWVAKPTALAKAQLLFNSVNNSLITITPGLVRTQTFLNYKMIQGRLSRFQVSLPQEINLLTVKGDNLKNWNLKKDKNRQVLEIELIKEAAEGYQLVLETEEVRDKIEDSYLYTISDIVSMDTERESGYMAVVVKDDLKIRSIAKRSGISQMDVEGLPDQLKREAGGEENVSLAYRYLLQQKELAFTIERVTPDIFVRNNLFLNVEEEVMKLVAVVDYNISKAGVFNFKLELPASMELIDVAGTDIENWKVNPVNKDDAAGVQVLEVQLRRKAIGEYRLKVELERPMRDILEDITMPQVNIIGANKVTGFIGISGDSSIRFKTKSRDRLTEVDLRELLKSLPAITNTPTLAYKFIAQPYSLELGVEKVNSRVMADVFTFLSLGEGLMLINSAIDFDILFAGIDRFQIALPQDAVGVDITGQGIKSKEKHVEEQQLAGKNVKVVVYTISLHSKVKGKYSLYCSYEKALKNLSQKTDMPALEIKNVERQSGYVAVGPRANVEIEFTDIEGASQVDVKELPRDKIAGIDIPILYALRYVRYPYIVGLDIKKHEDVSVLVAVVESANITTVMGKDGQIIVNAVYQIKNRAKQYLNLILPKDAAIWSTFVDGKAVKPAKTKEGNVLLPLVKHEEQERSFPVEITYETKRPRLFFTGQVRFSAPQFDIPVTNVTWSVYLPYGYNYHSLSGNMEKGHTLYAKADVRTSGGKVCAESPAVFGQKRNEESYRYDDKCRATKEIKKEAEYEREYSKAQDKPKGAWKDELFSSNINSQVARYNNQIALSQTEQISEGRQKGVLPIHITIPTGGKLFTFSKLMSRDPLSVNMWYVKKGGKFFSILLIITIIVLFAKKKDTLLALLPLKKQNKE
ncbi:MAG: hypothetical protein KJ893_06825 [Candidatus Omnitrophica bacterium]|nr:hypothetical protein [Candidatus Omnitrophota bacterium]MBU4478311.1 hypothetical protein [Candidatus Omnitrophota bacterium]MCG2703450.1 hypothetical protein [Candidatus Omnitrophota bacterium]